MEWYNNIFNLITEATDCLDCFEKQLALEAKQRFTELLGNLVTLKCGKFDKYGRILVEIYVNNICINEKMIEEGHGRPYDGGLKNEWFYNW